MGSSAVVVVVVVVALVVVVVVVVVGFSVVVVVSSVVVVVYAVVVVVVVSSDVVVVVVVAVVLSLEDELSLLPQADIPQTSDNAITPAINFFIKKLPPCSSIISDICKQFIEIIYNVLNW